MQFTGIESKAKCIEQIVRMVSKSNNINLDVFVWISNTEGDITNSAKSNQYSTFLKRVNFNFEDTLDVTFGQVFIFGQCR